MKQTIYVQISAGRGPAECAWVVAQVLKELMAFARQNKLEVETIHRNQGQERGTLNSCLVKVLGKEVEQIIQPWIGTIQWVGKSPFRKFHKRKNWFVGVSIFKESNMMKFSEKDLEFSTFRASGPGGQHRNKVETAVRVVHHPSGLAVTASDSKSQHQNKKAAIAKMKMALEQHQMEQLQARVDDQWREHLALQRGNPVKVFEGRDFKARKV
ncbi:MAG: peptide chain release factor H [Cytophagales bacterium]|nr:peptide chain release factor H [Cytophagales bacterium]